MQNFFEKFQSMPKNLQKEVIDFAEFLEKKQKKTKKQKNKKIDFSGWEGCLSDLKDKYSSVELQKEILKMW